MNENVEEIVIEEDGGRNVSEDDERIEKLRSRDSCQLPRCGEREREPGQGQTNMNESSKPVIELD